MHDSSSVIADLATIAPALKARGAAALFLFGSRARGGATEDSDVDLFVDVLPDRKFSLIDLAAMQVFLRSVLPYEVDLTTRRGLHPMVRDEIEREAIRVF